MFVTRVTRLIHNGGKYLLISIYPLSTHPTHNFTRKNGGNLDTLPGWPRPILTQGTLVPYNKMKNFCLYHKNISTESVMYDCQQLQQNKTKSKIQILKNCQKYKTWNFARNYTGDTPSEVTW